MLEKTRMVAEFHTKIGASIGLSLEDKSTATLAITALLGDVTVDMRDMSERMLRAFKQSECKDHRALRAHLMLEELSELTEAMATLDELAALDAIADLDYVVNGTAVTYGLPLEAAFEEIHRSNMTKTPQSSDPDRARVRDKGPDYVAPDLERVMGEHRGKPV